MLNLSMQNTLFSERYLFATNVWFTKHFHYRVINVTSEASIWRQQVCQRNKQTSQLYIDEKMECFKMFGLLFCYDNLSKNTLRHI